MHYDSNKEKCFHTYVYYTTLKSVLRISTNFRYKHIEINNHSSLYTNLGNETSCFVHVFIYIHDYVVVVFWLGKYKMCYSYTVFAFLFMISPCLFTPLMFTELSGSSKYNLQTGSRKLKGFYYC